MGFGAGSPDPSRRCAPHTKPTAGASLCLVTTERAWPSLPFLMGGGNFPNFPRGRDAGAPPILGYMGGESPPSLPTPCIPPRALASHLCGFCGVFFPFNTTNVYHLPNRLDRFCFLSSARLQSPPRLPRSRLPAPSRADLVFRAAPRRISVCKTKCFDGGRLQECLEAVWSFMGCAVRAVLARSPHGPARALEGVCHLLPTERREQQRRGGNGAGTSPL